MPSAWRRCFPGCRSRRMGVVVKGDTIELKGLRQAPVLAFSRIDAKAAWKSTLQF